MPNPIILPLRSNKANLSNAGGKGANLAYLAQAGFPVPDGFLVTTEAYRAFIIANAFQEKILHVVAASPTDDPQALRDLSDQIRGWFTQGEIPPQVISHLKRAYADLEAIPVAVRSSATAEDLPEASFAGQQDTFLNVIGEDQLLTALVSCWSSLWTARAIGYRGRNGIPHAEAALAVVVQAMVPAVSSGVLFTANPLSGLRTESVIDATLGLGEALVGGLVEPDHYVVDMVKRRILHKNLGAKKVALHGVKTGGVQRQELEAAQLQALPDGQILKLADLGQRIAESYHFPQDIEWAWANDQLYILQSRPITSLYPVPEGTDPGELQVFFSFGSVQGILEPLTPLGQDAIRLIFAGGASLFGYQVTYITQGVIHSAGERLWGNMTPVLRNSIGRKLAPRFLGVVEPSILPALQELMAQPPLNQASRHPRLDSIRRLVNFIRPMLKRVIKYWRHPEGQATHLQNEAEQEIEKLQARAAEIKAGEKALKQSLALFRQIYNAFVYVVPHFVPGIIAGLAPLALLNRLSQHLDVESVKALEITRGLPHNVTTQMDLDLWETARIIRADSAALAHMQSTPAAELADCYLNQNMPLVAQAVLADFLKHYGMRGVGEIDIGRPRWREDPTPIMQVIKSYLHIEADSQAPDVIFQQGIQAAERAIDEIEAAARRGLLGPLRAKIVRAAARRVRALAGLRESPKLHIIQMMGIIRKSLLERGEELVTSSVLQQPDDLFFLNLSELEALAAGENRDWGKLVAENRHRYRREWLRRQAPRLLLSDGRAYYEGIRSMDADSNALVGSPVSPGTVEGQVRVVLEPHNAGLEPGEILVCPATDPAWTPLFLAARGLVMEVGGMMTHGAIVAREYGIPAVVGVHAATQRLQTGQHIRVDGSSGKVIIIQD